MNDFLSDFLLWALEERAALDFSSPSSFWPTVAPPLIRFRLRAGNAETWVEVPEGPYDREQMKVFLAQQLQLLKDGIEAQKAKARKE